MKQVIPYEEAKKMTDIQFIDVRSPAEFAEACIPEAINIPLYNEEERHELGITYKEQGAAPARMRGLQLAAPKLPHLVEEILAACAGKIPVLYCWRGGTRSESVFVILHLLRIPAYQLQGGYKGYRRYVHQRLEDFGPLPQAVVLHGLTGVGKTRILLMLKDLGYPVLDLEGLALHRGSVFGSLGLPNPRSQKSFEGLLLQELEKYRDAPYLLMEGEGKKVGPVYVPTFLVEQMRQGHHILLEAPLETRVERILKEYVQDRAEVIEGAKESLTYISERLGREGAGRIRVCLEEGRIRDAVRELCAHYYDHLYLDSRKDDDHYAASVDATGVEEAVASLEAYLEGIFPGGNR